MDQEFEPRLGTMQSGGSRRSGNYLRTILAARGRVPKGRSAGRFTGERIGRGTVAARMFCLRAAHDGLHWRRAIIIARVVRLGVRGLRAARAHLNYIERDAGPSHGEHGRLYSGTEDEADGKAFLKRCSGDRHQFRLMISAEDGAQYDELRPLIRRFMTRMEEDLGTRLEWIAADHADTPHPHTHLILRGRDQSDGDLVIARAYITSGMRERLIGLISLDLGPRSDFEIEQHLRLEVEAERLTSLDHRLLGEMAGRAFVEPEAANLVDHSLLIGRLRKLERLGFAQKRASGGWILSDELEPALLSLEQRTETLRTMQRALKAAGIERAPVDQLIYRPEDGGTIIGRIIARGVADELTDRHYLIIDGLDGRSHSVALEDGEASEPLRRGAIVRVAPTFARDEAPAPAANLIEAARSSPSRGAGVAVELLSPVPLEDLASHDGATWLDRLLLSNTDDSRDAGFGRQVRCALALRRSWLVDQGLAEREGAAVIYRPGLIATLTARELARAGTDIAAKTGLEFVTPQPGIEVEGVVRRRIELASGRFILIDNRREFSLIPWRPVLEKAFGRNVRATVDAAGGISWTLLRSRAIEL